MAPFRSRAQLREIDGFGEKTFEQAAGFLRIKDGENPLDRTAVHPESYPVVERLASGPGISVAELIENPDRIHSIDFHALEAEVGKYTIADIREELLKPGRDPRDKFTVPKFREDVKEIADLKEGMELEGTVTNVTNFGAFVDLGVHQDGLVHISELSHKYIQDARQAAKVGDIVKVKVIGVDQNMKRISLSMKALLPKPAPRPKKKRRPVAEATAAQAAVAAPQGPAPETRPQPERPRRPLKPPPPPHPRQPRPEQKQAQLQKPRPPKPPVETAPCRSAADDGRKDSAPSGEVRTCAVMNKPRIKRMTQFNPCNLRHPRLLHTMSFREAIVIALSSLRANRLRSLLTLLGIVIGVMTVIAVVSFISGLNDYVAQKIFNLGPDVFIVNRTAFVTMSEKTSSSRRNERNLYLEDMEAVRRACTDCRSVGGSVNARAQVKYGRQFLDSSIQGYTAEVPGFSATNSRADDSSATMTSTMCAMFASLVQILLITFFHSSIRSEKPSR